VSPERAHGYMGVIKGLTEVDQVRAFVTALNGAPLQVPYSGANLYYAYVG